MELLQEEKLKELSNNYSKLNSFELALEMHTLVQNGVPQKNIAEQLLKSNAWVSRITTAYRKASPVLKEAWGKNQIKLSAVMEISQYLEEDQPKALMDKLNTPRLPSVKPLIKQISSLITIAEQAPDSAYARGILDVARLITGQIKVDDFSDEWKHLLGT